MNNSGQICVVDNDYRSVYLYTHNTAHELINVVREVLDLKQNWDDPDYLSRMLFCRMVPKEEWYNNKNFGIGTNFYANCELMITVDIKNQIISISSKDRRHENSVQSFEDFLDLFEKKAYL